jgi:hypothetical protein
MAHFERPMRETMIETLSGRQTGGYVELIRSVNHQTHQQVQDLSIHNRGGHLVVTGRSPSYYVKQLVTQSIRRLVPSAGLLNEICVGLPAER